MFHRVACFVLYACRGGNVDGRSKIKKEEKKKMLSFNMDEEEEEEEEESNGAVSDRTKTPSDCM